MSDKRKQGRRTNKPLSDKRRKGQSCESVVESYELMMRILPLNPLEPMSLRQCQGDSFKNTLTLCIRQSIRASGFHVRSISSGPGSATLSLVPRSCLREESGGVLGSGYWTSFKHGALLPGNVWVQRRTVLSNGRPNVAFHNVMLARGSGRSITLGLRARGR